LFGNPEQLPCSWRSEDFDELFGVAGKLRSSTCEAGLGGGAACGEAQLYDALPEKIDRTSALQAPCGGRRMPSQASYRQIKRRTYFPAKRPHTPSKQHYERFESRS